MKKVLIIQNKILHYRKALYNELSTKYNVTVLHSGEKSLTKEDNYKEIISNKTKILYFEIQHDVLSEVRNNYDVVVAMLDLHWLNCLLIPYFIKNKTNLIWWGQWLTGNIIADKFRIYFSKGKRNSILYTESAKKEFINKGVSEKKLFVANNTIDVEIRYKCFNELNKSNILFIGSLNKRKQLDVLLMAFKEIIHDIPKSINLIIVGNGEEKDKLNTLIGELELNDRVFMKGKITSNKLLLDFYKKAIVNVSFGQAGLSVLQSFGYGVPFITKVNAISGGEKTNIIDGYNGYFCEDTVESLKSKLLLIIGNKELAKELGKNAYDYYSEKCTIKNMAKGFIDAIEIGKKNKK